MRNKRIITIATLVAVVALTVSIPVFASGCGDDDFAYGGRMAQQYQDCDRDYDGRGMMGRQGQNQDFDRDGICDQDADCLGSANGNTQCDGDCDGAYDADCPGAVNGGCDGDCLNEQGLEEPLCF